jgi:hypothetical protein
MKDKNHEAKNDPDRALDAALAKYAAVAPGPGLEERIMANLHAERMRVPERAWWNWGIAAAVAAVIVVGVAFTWKSSRPVQQIVHHAPTQQNPKQLPQAVAKDAPESARNVMTPTPSVSAHHSPPVIAAVAANPRLDVFPSPQPLSEQEKLLLDYVHQSPTEAAQIARAQTELAAREESERAGLQPGAGQSGNIKNVFE